MARKNSLSERQIQRRLEFERHSHNLYEKQKRQDKRRSISGQQKSGISHKRRKKNTFDQTQAFLEEIPLPNNLDLITSFEEVAKITREIRRIALRDKKSLVLNFDLVRSLKPAALLLLLAEIHRCRLIHGAERVTGNYPNEPRIERMLDATGFFKLLGVVPRNKAKLNKYPMEYVDFVSNIHEVKGTVKTFREKLLGTSITMTPSAKSRLYRVISEAMLNVSYHAYPRNASKTNPQRGRWWLAGHVNRRSKELMIMFCDLGVGIPRTLPKLYRMETIRQILSILPGVNPNDGQMIQAAMELGRSRSGLTNRGRGLNDLRSFVDNAGSGDLHIFSGHGHYHYNPLTGERIKNYGIGIAGTLIKWTVPMAAVTNWAGDGDEDADPPEDY